MRPARVNSLGLNGQGGANSSSWFLSALVLATVVQQSPSVIQAHYQAFRLALYVGFGAALFVASVSPSTGRAQQLLRKFTTVAVYGVGLVIICALFGSDMDLLLLSELLVPLGVLFCSARTRISAESLNILLGLYVALSCVLAVLTVWYYGIGFEITAVYVVDSKNQVGPILAIACLIALWFAFNINETMGRHRYSLVILCAASAALLFTALQIVRNRSGIIGVVLVAAMLITKEIGRRHPARILVWIVLTGAVLGLLWGTGWLNTSWQFLWDSITLNHDVTDADAFSGGRTDVYAQALAFLWSHPLFGDLGPGTEFGHIAHNYIVNKLVAFGLLGSFPFVLFYVSLWKRALWARADYRKVDRTLPLWRCLLLFALLISLFEYTYPFGPGVSTVMVWFLLGQETEPFRGRAGVKQGRYGGLQASQQ